jgi:hypothetical protein
MRLAARDLKFFVLMRVFYLIGFIASTQNSLKSETMLKAYANNLGKRIFIYLPLD